MDELLPYYNRELAFFRRMANEFAKANPKVASRLRLGQDSSEDPHVERLIQAFALLNARTRHKLEDDFPEISDALISVLHPHFLAPIPSMAIIQYELDESQGGTEEAVRVDRGTEIDTEPIDGEPCRFRSAFDVDLWPFQVESAQLAGLPFEAPQTSQSDRASGALRLSLRMFDEETTFANLPLDKIRFYLNGFAQHVNPLYEILFNNTLQVALATSPKDDDPIVLNANCLQAVGFEPDELVLPYSPRSPLAYTLLNEYFSFPEKFLFFDLSGLAGKLDRFGSELHLFFYVDRATIDLERNISASTFRLGCTPIVNLYRQRAEPIQATETQWEYRVIGDARRPNATEVYSIDHVAASSPDGQEVDYQPFYSVKHSGDLAGQKFWASTRRNGEALPEDDGSVDRGSEVYLSLVNIDNAPAPAANWYLDVETTCLNRDLPERLPFGGGQPALYFAEAGGPATIRCLTPPTPTRRPPRKHGAMWRLISHLSAGHLSLVGGEEGARALGEILKLYDFHDSPETRELIESIVEVNSRRVVGRTGDGICRGTEVQLTFRSEQFSENGLFVFAAVLERFLGSYCSLNSFSQLVIQLKGRDGILRRWKPRSGTQVLL